MMTFDEFAEANRYPSNTLEGKMARAYLKTIEELESANKDLWKTMRVDYFLPEYEEPLLAIDEAEERLSQIQTDIEDFMNIVGGYSRRDIAEKLNRSKLDIKKAKRKALNVWKNAIQEHTELNPDDVGNNWMSYRLHLAKETVLSVN
jgi:hypothetical protein